MVIRYETKNSLSHHGIKGQKWGIRRFQNKDGTLTAKGKKRYKDNSVDVKNMSDDELRSKISRMRNEKKYIDLTKKESTISKFTEKFQKKASLGSKAIENQKKMSKLKGNDTSNLEIAGQGTKAITKSASAIGKIDKMISDPKHVKKAEEMLKNMSDEDLKKVVDRLDLEKQFSDVSKDTRKRGKVTAEQVLDVAGDVLTVTASVVGIVVGLKTLQNMAGGSGTTIPISFKDLS